MTAFRSSSRGRTTALRENASSSRVRSAARPAASSIERDVSLDPRRRLIVENEPAVAGDDREQVVEVVSDPAGETADRVEALRLVRLLLGPEMRRAVDDRAGETRPPVVPGHDDGGDVDEGLLAVRPHHDPARLHARQLAPNELAPAPASAAPGNAARPSGTRDRARRSPAPSSR